MDMTLRPGDFPIGSVESRAAMWAMIERERSEEFRPFLRNIEVGHPREDCKGKWCFKPLDFEAGNPVMGKLSPGVCRLTTGELVVFPDGRVGSDLPMNFGGAHGHT
jgi:hypothetical protein